MNRRQLLAVVAGLGLAVLSGVSQAQQEWPTKTIK